MENLETIIELLYKRTSIQKIIHNEINCTEFEQDEFMRMVTAYVYHYSENEAWNLLNYFLDTFQEFAKRSGRKISRKLSVFEPLFFYAKEFLLIKNNEVCCQYSRLMEWQKITTALSEDLLVSAFFAEELPQDVMRARGYAWDTVIGHNNNQLNAVVHRGISENHSHLNGAAPIFHISWLSLMNNTNNSQLGQKLRTYDKDRRYTNVAYTSSYRERSFHEKYIQAALIRLLLYCKISGKLLKIGSYKISTSSICNYITLPDFRYNDFAGKLCLNKDSAGKISKKLEEKKQIGQCSFRDTILFIIEVCIAIPGGEKSDWETLWKQNVVLEELLKSDVGDYMLDVTPIIDILCFNTGVPLSQVFLKILFLTDNVSLEDVQRLFFNRNVYESFWEKRTLSNVKELLRYPEELLREQSYLQSLIDVFRLGENRNSHGFEDLDYILGHLKSKEASNRKDNFIFSGEHWLMYAMLRKIYLNDREYLDYFNLFYAYLLIKESIRSELIQSNQNVGFRNFQRYQSRKGDLLVDQIYKKEFTRLAVSNSLVSKSIQKMELRITPKSDLKKLCKQIQELDQIVLPNKSWERHIFYTVHFIKSPDKPPKDTTYMHCRHYEQRNNTERGAYALTGLRERYPDIGKRILGIDAAANEIGCRAEVFAPMFRYMKNHRYRYPTADGMKKLPQLRATYHVGEDFLDLADGLRAIEEAILFLNLDFGDRLGHALALGIDVKEWYQVKRYRISLPLQDHLDNLVWIFDKIIQYDIRGFENLKEWILSEYAVLFGKLYIKNMQQGEIDKIFQKFVNKKRTGTSGNYQKLDFGIFNYYNAWKLRGDDPQLYESGYFEENKYIEKQEEFRVNFHYLKGFRERRIPEAALLYYMYHFNGNIREAGAKTMEVVVPTNYVEAVAVIQKAMQRDIAKRGIAIETNPSSNYLIGTFRQYEKHPIIRFYNKGLVHDPEKLIDCPQLSVSINTDDQGVFSTSLEKEYALMARALESVKDESGNYVYNKSDIYEWLDRVRIMGNEQSFALNCDQDIEE